ncbi:MAG TPA: hypothetical protein HA254_02540 [Candidatus Diapherotrites archaeon]|uniref:Uncharacterized protein n=1 Tax=Candidatus Iainarchaeum sp. TaxID=3101447 RepID=A0A7J4J2R5_9ARCH|nr:hypothetical protein [Candidatus Diapherotrites archaeon]
MSVDNPEFYLDAGPLFCLFGLVAPLEAFASQLHCSREPFQIDFMGYHAFVNVFFRQFQIELPFAFFLAY